MSEIIKGVLLLLTSLALFVVMTFMCKLVLVKFHLSAFEVTYTFCAPLIFLSYIGVKLIAPKETDILNIPKDKLLPLLGRSITGFLTDVILFLAFTYTSYSKAFAINKTESLFSPFIAYYTIGEAVRAVDILGIIISFGGMLLMLQPWSAQEQGSLRNDMIGFSWALLGAIVNAWLFVFCRMISQDFHYSVPMIYYMLLGALFTPLMSLFLPTPKVELIPVYDMEFYVYIIVIVTLSYMAFLMFNASWRYNTVGTSAILIYLGIPMSYLLDWAVIGREVTLVEIFGAALITVTNVTIVLLRLFNYIK